MLDGAAAYGNNGITGASQEFSVKSVRKLSLAAMLMLAACGPAIAQTKMDIVSDANCGCCNAWVKHLEQSGYTTSVTHVAPDALMTYKTQHGLKPQLTSCHTGMIGGYVIEGHVPAKEIARLLREKPDAIGLTVPGMPYGSPGMGPASEAEPYQVLLVKKDGTTAVYASYP